MAEVGSVEKPLIAGDAMEAARGFVKAQFTSTHGLQGIYLVKDEYWVWTKGKWVVTDKQWVVDLCWHYLDKLHVSKGREDMEPYKPSNEKVGNVMRALDSLIRFKFEKTPTWLGGDSPVDVNSTIAFEDVLIDIKASVEQGMIVSHPRDEHWFDTVVVPVVWNPTATAPRWEQALHEWSGSDPLWEALLQRWFGYVLMSTRKYAKWLLLYGKIRGGKGSIARVMRALLGETGFFGTTLDNMSGEFGLDGVQNARVMDVSEVNELDAKSGEKAARIIKNMVGQDSIPINIKNIRQIRNVIVAAAPMVEANEIPKLPNKGRGLSGKMLVLPFDHSFEGKEDFHLDEKLLAELQGIARWAVEGAIKLEMEAEPQKKWVMPARSQDAIKMYHLANNPFDSFLENRFIKNQNGFVSTEVVWQQWLKWLETNQVKVSIPRDQITRRILAESSWNVRRSRPAQGGPRGLAGMSLKPEYLKEEDDE